MANLKLIDGLAVNVPESYYCEDGYLRAPTGKLEAINKHIESDKLKTIKGFGNNELIQFEFKHLREPIKQKSEKWEETSDHWLVICKGQTFDFYTGIGHRVAKGLFNQDKVEFNNLKNKNLTEYGFKQFLSLSKPVAPTPTDVLYSLISDAEAENMSFSEWCSNFGYEEDSRKAEKTYFACQENAQKLRKLGLNLEELREALQDY